MPSTDTERCDCEGHAHVKDAYFERNCARCGCRKGTGSEPSIYEVELHPEQYDGGGSGE